MDVPLPAGSTPAPRFLGDRSHYGIHETEGPETERTAEAEPDRPEAETLQES